jgi:hypothetical protein
MANPNFRVTIPTNAQELSGLGTRITDKHELDGVDSVLTPLDMDDFLAKNTLAIERDAASKQLDRDKEKAYADRDFALGIDNDNPDTVDFYVKSSRDVLFGFNKGKEQNLGNWGFNVNMSSGFVSVEIPKDAPGLIALADLIIKKHVLDGVASPLTGLNMTDFTAKQATSAAKHKLGQQLNRDKEKATKERDKALGIAPGQKVDTPGTVRFYITSVRDALLGFNKGREYNLGDWGFDVQFSTGPGAPTGTFTVAPSSVAAGESAFLDWNISGSSSVEIDNGIGAVAATGNLEVTPAASTTYKLTATSASGGVLTITATLTVA